MLAQLDKVPGVAESRIDWTGHYFLLKVADGVEPEGVVDPAREVLGSGAQRLKAAAETEQIAAFEHGEPWMRSGETLRLSGEEARVLGDRFTTDAAKESGLDAAKTQRLRELVQDETKRLLESLHAEGGNVSDRFMTGWAPAVQRVHERSREFLTQAESDRVSEILRARFDK